MDDSCVNERSRSRFGKWLNTATLTSVKQRSPNNEQETATVQAFDLFNLYY